MASFHHQIKSGKKGSAQHHAKYINRDGRYSTREDLIHAAYGNMPDWCRDNPNMFWSMADLHERANGAAYREHVIALPNELTAEQLIALAERMVRELIGTKPYQYAIHAPEGQLGGIRNPHLHLMYSDRMPDGVQRPAERVFARFNPGCPGSGGWRKDSGGMNRLELRSQVIATRKAIADLQNEALTEGGYDARVDHRTLREQGQQRRPERHLGAARVRDMSPDERAAYAAHRPSRAPMGS